MKFTYKPEGTEEHQWKVWVVDPKKILNVESEAVEKVTGMRFPEWNNAVMEESTTAIHGLLWVLLKRENPTLAYNAVEFTYDEYELDLDDTQKADLVKALEESREDGDITPEGEQILAEYKADLARVEPLVEDVDDPKEDSAEPNSEPDTSGTSPTFYTPPALTSIS